ncbi:putative transporter SVOPL [Mizuhopecten yessoensis]|uniref:Transporter SVOPL n=1 Tax=Mizuhopecten yessoensis TaxID=6573 RepID=A0A210Q0K9_MIZYE|nr:putative transporter SVOPL [Mizuhopecten yessoensis]XP_021370469.1 putative transporter SVOPL [Mizuhopecten yessoensis]OWF42245.1 transporter SVOPL [Mizuhopecten yessoensis]
METLLSDSENYYDNHRRGNRSHAVRYSKVRVSDLEDESDEIDGDLEGVSLIRREAGNDLEDDYKGKTFTVQEAIDSLGLGPFQLKLFVICGLFTAADAMEMMLLAVLSPVLRCEWQLEKYQVALITTVVFIGMGITAPIWGAMGDKFGRRTTLYMVSLWIGYFGLLTTFSPSYIWILILRSLVGGGLAGSPQSFAILTEYLPSKHRAKLLNLTQISWAMGTSFEIIVAAIVLPSLGWRWLLFISAIPSFIICIVMKFLPESARYLVAAGRREEAIKVLEKAARTNSATIPEGRLVCSSPVTQQGKMSDLFSPMYRKTTLQLWVLWFVTAFSYYGMVLASAEILQVHNAKNEGGENCSCNLLEYDDYITMIISTIGEFICLPVNMILFDIIGRRKTGAIDLTGCAVFFILLQINMPQHLLTGIMLLVRGFSAANFNFVYIYTAEVYPTTVRTLGIGTASAWARVGAMLTPFVAQVLLDQSLSAAVWVYGSLGLIAAICSWTLPIETKSRVLPQSVKLEEEEES